MGTRPARVGSRIPSVRAYRTASAPPNILTRQRQRPCPPKSATQSRRPQCEGPRWKDSAVLGSKERARLGRPTLVVSGRRIRSPHALVILHCPYGSSRCGSQRHRTYAGQSGGLRQRACTWPGDHSSLPRYGLCTA